MPKTESMTLVLPAEVVAMVRGAVEQGRYASVDEVVSDAIRHWTPGDEDVNWLSHAWRDAMADPGRGEPMEAAMDRLDPKYRALYAESDAKKCA